MRPLAIDLFSGAGGLSLGFEQAGFDVAAAVEIDPIHAAVHRYNFPHTVIMARSVIGLRGWEIRRAAGIGNAPIDCVFGGPPCQGFSLMGHRSLEDERNRLVLEFVRIVAELRAKTFVFENVKGLTVGRQKLFLEELILAFDIAGYEVRTPWQVLDSANYGVPQHRQRLILFGSRKGTKIPTYPSPRTIAADDEAPLFGLPKGPTCKDAIGDLPDAELFKQLEQGDAVKTARFCKPSTYASQLRCLSPTDWYFGYKREWRSEFLTSSARTDHSRISRRRFANTAPGEVEPVSRFLKLSPDGLSNTLRAGTDGARGAFTSPRPIHYSLPRCITVREMARLHGFPDWFRLHATKWHGARQIGNAVPPPMARAVAEQVMVALGKKATKPKRVLRLSEDGLLTLTMAKAAIHLGAIPLNGRRDRKSGVRKRKQEEVEAARIAAE